MRREICTYAERMRETHPSRMIKNIDGSSEVSDDAVLFIDSSSNGRTATSFRQKNFWLCNT